MNEKDKDDNPEKTSPEEPGQPESTPGLPDGEEEARDAADAVSSSGQDEKDPEAEPASAPDTTPDTAPDTSAEPEKQPTPEAVAEPDPTPAAGSEPPATPAPPARPVGHQSDRPASGRGLLVVALLISLGALGLAGWLYLQQATRMTQQQALESRLETEFERIRETADDARDAATTARSAIEQAVDATRRANTELRDLVADERARMADQIADQRTRLADQIAEQGDALRRLEASLARQRQELQGLRSSDRIDWSLAEAEYLLRLAFQRLLMAEDVASAIALMRSADTILRDLDDPDLLPARESIARDLAALRAVPALDVDGTWLRLQALAERVDSLLLFELTLEGGAREELPEDASWRERLSAGLSAALAKVSDYLVIRRREQPYQTLIDPQWEQLVRQNLRMQIAQAQASLLAGNPDLYNASLTATRRWLQEFFDFNESDVAALSRELDALMGVKITRDYPDIGGSLRAVQSAIDRRHAAGGGSGP